MTSKRPYLVIDDYGNAGIWAYLWAESDNRIKQEFPGLNVIDELPGWLAKGDSPKLRSIDIDRPDKWLDRNREAKA